MSSIATAAQLLQTLIDPFPNANGNDQFGGSIAVVNNLLVVAPGRGGDLLVFQPTPEPQSIALAAMGVSTVALFRRRRTPAVKRRNNGRHAYARRRPAESRAQSEPRLQFAARTNRRE